MKALAVSALLSLTLFACGSKKDPPPATDPPKGSAEPPKGSAAEPPKPDPGSGAAPAGSGSDAAGSAAAGSGSDAGSGSAVAKFDDLTHDQKLDFMKKQVVPKMKPMFQKFDPKEFANFGCKTCHGKDPQKSKYKMPSPDIDKLDFAELQAGKGNVKMAKWMGEVVKPEMAKLLGEPEYSDTNPKGFGCLHCHLEKKK